MFIVVFASAVYGSHIETSPNHFKVVDCYFFGTGSPWSCLLTPKRGNSYLNEIYALYIVQVKCTFLGSGCIICTGYWAIYVAQNKALLFEILF